ncbi:TerD family protein [Histomonas meleagridis]|uniref:TerD family protein n=1 Tax=Histomonas meleagridis TaxID=135588 RepID=UPI00355A78C9|nr:TerD family protein [Histomonas meleagridis]KAH0805048.1 TerD family protein [Histomonas meleagridis]
MFKIYIESAENIVNPSSKSPPDPYVKVFSYTAGTRYFLGETKYAKKTTNPVWDVDFKRSLTFPFFYTENLTLKIYDHNVLQKDVNIGTAIVPMLPENHDKPIKIPVQSVKDAPANSFIMIKYLLPCKNFSSDSNPETNFSYHLFFTYPQPYFPSPTEFRIYTREYNIKDGLVKCYPLSNEIQTLPYFQNSEGLCLGPSGLTPFFRFQTTYSFQDTAFVLFISPTTYSGPITLNILSNPHLYEFSRYQKLNKKAHYTTNIYDVSKYKLIEQCTFNVTPNTVTAAPTYVRVCTNLVVFQKLKPGHFKTNQLTFDMSHDFGLTASQILYPNQKFWQRLISAPDRPLSFSQALQYYHAKYPKEIIFALGWENCNIDLSCIAYSFNNGKYSIETIVYYSKVSSLSGAIQHSGRNKEGCKRDIEHHHKTHRYQDDEKIRIKFKKFPKKKSIKYFAICITSPDLIPINEVDAAYLRILSDDKKFEYLFYPIPKARKTASIIALAEYNSQNDAWDINPLYYNTSDHNPKELANRFLSVMNNEEEFSRVLSGNSQNYNYNK